MDLEGWELFDLDVVDKAGEDACYVMDLEGNSVRLLQKDDSYASPRWQYQDGRPIKDEPAFMKRIAKVRRPADAILATLIDAKFFMDRIDGATVDGQKSLLLHRSTLVDMGAKLIGMRSKNSDKILREQRMVERYRDSDPEMAQFARESIDEANEHNARIDEHYARITRKLEILNEGPSKVLLPIGTHVRFAKDYVFPTWALDGGSYGLKPEQGWQAVVLGPSPDREWPIQIGLIGRVSDSDGYYETNVMDPIKMSMDMEFLEVIAPGTFLDGSECTSYELVPTHLHDGRPEMVVVSAGRPWRIHKHTTGNMPYYEAQGREPDDALEFLTPIESGDVEPAPAFR